MKCPKCGYLGFETSERCRNCGYDFSLSVKVDSPAELPLRDADGAGAPLADFDLSDLSRSRESGPASGIDLDRLIGTDESDVSDLNTAASTALSSGGPPQNAREVSSRHPPVAATATPRPPAGRGSTPPGLPLFTARGDDFDDTPLITTPRPARPPLSVRRTTPEIPKGRQRPARTTPVTDAPMALDLEPSTSDPEPPTAVSSDEVATGNAPAGLGARLLAAAIDLVLLAAIDVGVVYLTLAIAGLPMQQAAVIPRIPLIAFLAMLNGGYLVVFTAASGQTIGKMLTGIRVIGDDGRRVDMARAVIRSAGCALSLLTAGLGYLPAFITANRRALQDRISGTSVVRDK